MSRFVFRNVIFIAALAMVFGACVDSPSAPLAVTEQNPLATNFDMLSQEQLMASDIERSEDFRWAALALRTGVAPSVIQVTNDGRPEVYDGFVQGASWVSSTQALRPPQHRSLVAWRRNGDLLQVLLVDMFTDSAPIMYPYSMRSSAPGVIQSAVRGANAAYFERGPRNQSWLGISGMAKIAEHPQPSVCPQPDAEDTRPNGVLCQYTRFGIELNVQFAVTRSRDSREVDIFAPGRRVIAPNQTVAGVKLLFSCISPLSTGCN